MARKNAEPPVTPAVRLFRERGVAFTPRLYDYEEHGGTARAARELGVDEHEVVKTLVFQTDAGAPLLVLMHGDREVSARQLARLLGVRSVTPAEPAAAQRLTGYMVGGISPFGTRTRIPVYIEATILDLPRILINGGKRGFLVEMDPREVQHLLEASTVSAATTA